jgi:hypothetical protein
VSDSFKMALIWMVGSLIAVTVALAMLSTSLVDGQYLPVGHDSFYHARRILDTVLQPGGFYEFDPKMHFPEGDWITWPWGYDYLMAQAVRGLMALSGSVNPMKLLVHLPPMFVPVAVGLVLAISSTLRLSETLKWLAVLCVALSPYTQGLFGVGSIDHHWAEQLLTLGMVLCGMLWLQRPESAGRSAALGVVLGAAVACQAGLFMLQLPVLIGLALLWFRGAAPPARTGAVLAVALVLTTLLVSLPSAPFRMGWFQLYYLSWFQLYIASCTALFVVALCRWPYRPKVLLGMALLAVALLVPVLAQLEFTGAFLSGRLATVQQIDEIKSPYSVALTERGLWRVTQLYTPLVFIAPLTLIGCVISLLRERQREIVFFWAASIFGLVFVMLQQRLHGFGSFALYVPLLVFVQRFGDRFPQRRALATALLGLGLVAAYAPPIRYQLFARHPPGMNEYYAGDRLIFPALAKACQARPGLVVADTDDGHMVRYFTECSVIGNNFLLTPKDVEKSEETARLLAMPLDQVLHERPEVRYVLARLAASEKPRPIGVWASTPESEFTVARLAKINRGLFGGLLLGPRPLPGNVKPLVEFQIETNGEKIPFIGLYEVSR